MRPTGHHDLRPAHLDPILLGPDTADPDHPVADPQRYGGDLALLNYLLQDLRVVVRQIASRQRSAADHETIEWRVHGLQRRTVLCDVEALLAPVDREIVGFFGDRRLPGSPGSIDDGAVESAELEVVGNLRHAPGIVSYSSIELMGHQWANLVVHRRAEDRSDWREAAVHIRAAEELAPKMYHNVRIHNGHVPDGPIGSGTVVIGTTKYWDYDTTPMWHALRTLPGGVAARVDPDVGAGS